MWKKRIKNDYLIDKKKDEKFYDEKTELTVQKPT